jgi:hypothetical protein
MTREEFARLVEERGGLAGQPIVVDPEIDNPDPTTARRQPKIPNPNPKRKYIFNNGTQLEARGSGDEVDAEGRPLEVQITDAGSALKPVTSSTEGVSAPKDQQFIISRKPDGTLVSDKNPNFTGEKDEKSTLTPFGDNLYRVAPDGTMTVVATKSAQDKEPTTVAFGDTLYSFDGKNVTALISKPKEPSKPTTEVRNGKTYQWDPAANSWSEAAGLPSETKPATASVNTTAKYIVYYDDQGNEVSRNANPNYEPKQPTQLTADTVSPNIPFLQPDGTVKWVKNENRVPASQAMQDLLAQVGVKVNGGDLSMTDAKDLLSGTVNVMNAQTAATNAQTAQQTQGTQAATGALQALGQGAQTGAGLLQNRVSNATSMLNGILGMAGQGQRSGNMGGGLMSAPAGLGEALVGGIQGWATELGGGQGIYDTAARLVQQADPTNSPQAQAAYGVLTQMLEKYKQTTGEDHPAVAATNAAIQSGQNGGITAPAVTTPQQLANIANAGQQTAAATANAAMPFGAIGNNPMLAAQQARNRQLAGQQLAAETAIPANAPFVAPQTGMASLFVPGNAFVAPPLPTVT